MFPSTSPENTFAVDGVRVAVSETTEMTMAILRELFANYLNVCKILDLEDDITPTVREALPRLLPTRIASDGRVMEWYREKQDYDIRHRHLSQLYGFYPAHAYRPDNAPELCEACRRSIEAKGRKTVGWSLAWRSCLYAALGDGEMAYAFLQDQLRLTDDTNVAYSGGGGSYPNLFGACPPFQIDSNFGITAAIVEMLLQSDMDTVHVIPALPAAWSDVSVRGLRAKGKRKISFTVRGGELVACRIEGGKPNKILLAGKDMTAAFDEKGVFVAKL